MHDVGTRHGGANVACIEHVPATRGVQRRNGHGGIADDLGLREHGRAVGTLMDDDLTDTASKERLCGLLEGPSIRDAHHLFLVPEKRVYMWERGEDGVPPVLRPTLGIGGYVQGRRRAHCASTSQESHGRRPHEPCDPPEPGPVDVAWIGLPAGQAAAFSDGRLK